MGNRISGERQFAATLQESDAFLILEGKQKREQIERHSVDDMQPFNQFKKLDVRPLLKQGGEPYEAIRKAIESLHPGQGLMLVAPFLPSPLIEKMQSEGYQSKLERGKGSDWVVYFWKEEDAP